MAPDRAAHPQPHGEFPETAAMAAPQISRFKFFGEFSKELVSVVARA
jgi:hypothetical protein